MYVCNIKIIYCRFVAKSSQEFQFRILIVRQKSIKLSFLGLWPKTPAFLHKSQDYKAEGNVFLRFCLDLNEAFFTQSRIQITRIFLAWGLQLKPLRNMQEYWLDMWVWIISKSKRCDWLSFLGYIVLLTFFISKRNRSIVWYLYNLYNISMLFEISVYSWMPRYSDYNRTTNNR